MSTAIFILNVHGLQTLSIMMLDIAYGYLLLYFFINYGILKHTGLLNKYTACPKKSHPLDLTNAEFTLHDFQSHRITAVFTLHDYLG